MKDIAILISPVANGAYFNETIDIAQKEFKQCIGEYDLTLNEIGGMQFLQTQLPEQKLEALARLSFVQGIFSHDSGTLTPLSLILILTYTVILYLVVSTKAKLMKF